MYEGFQVDGVGLIGSERATRYATSRARALRANAPLNQYTFSIRVRHVGGILDIRDQPRQPIPLLGPQATRSAGSGAIQALIRKKGTSFVAPFLQLP